MSMNLTFEERKQEVIKLSQKGHSTLAITSLLLVTSDYVRNIIQSNPESNHLPETVNE